LFLLPNFQANHVATLNCGPRQEERSGAQICRPFNGLSYAATRNDLSSGAATIHTWSFGGNLSLLRWGSSESKKTNAGKRRHEEEHMAINVMLWIILISIPALLYSGCILTRKKKSPDVPDVAAPYELDHAA
jgi:hypothetical protein